MILGEFIGQGKHRKVFKHPFCSDRVIKYNYGNQSPKNNKREWKAWLKAKDTKWAETLAPCYEISDCGYYLVQHKCQPYISKTNTPRGIIDRGKKKNWGSINGRPVLLDYDNCSNYLKSRCTR